MPRINGTTDRQSFFLRSFRTTPTGPAPSHWPAPAVLRRWLRRPAFKRALDTILASLRFQADFHLQTAAISAASKLASADSTLSAQDLKPLADILRLAHLRQRFPTSGPIQASAPTGDDPKNLPDPSDYPSEEQQKSPVYFDILCNAERLVAWMELAHHKGIHDYDHILTAIGSDVFTDCQKHQPSPALGNGEHE